MMARSTDTRQRRAGTTAPRPPLALVPSDPLDAGIPVEVMLWRARDRALQRWCQAAEAERVAAQATHQANAEMNVIDRILGVAR